MFSTVADLRGFRVKVEEHLCKLLEDDSKGVDKVKFREAAFAEEKALRHEVVSGFNHATKRLRVLGRGCPILYHLRRLCKGRQRKPVVQLAEAKPDTQPGRYCCRWCYSVKDADDMVRKLKQNVLSQKQVQKRVKTRHRVVVTNNLDYDDPPPWFSDFAHYLFRTTVPYE